MILPIAIFAQVQMGVVVRPETVTVGEHFSATVRVRAPLGSTIKFPVGPDSGSAVDSAGPQSRQDTTGTDFVESTVTYVLAAWDTGSQKLALGDVIVEGTAGERRAPLSNSAAYVRSVLPADTALRKPKPLRPLVDVAVFNWMPWIIAGALLLLLALLAALWRWLRRRRSAPVSSMSWAESAFQRVEALKLLDSPNPERHTILMAEVLREYLARQFGHSVRSATTRQLAAILRTHAADPGERVILLFERVDLLKFAQGWLSREDAEKLGLEARAIVREMDARILAAAQAAALAAAQLNAQTEADAKTAKPKKGTKKGPKNGAKAA